MQPHAIHLRLVWVQEQLPALIGLIPIQPPLRRPLSIVTRNLFHARNSCKARIHIGIADKVDRQPAAQNVKLSPARSREAASRHDRRSPRFPARFAKAPLQTGIRLAPPSASPADWPGGEPEPASLLPPVPPATNPVCFRATCKPALGPAPANPLPSAHQWQTEKSQTPAPRHRHTRH